MDRRLLIGAFALLLFEVTWLLYDLGVLGVRFSNLPAQPGHEQPAGELVSLDNQVRRRAFNSLIWQAPNHKEPVYYRDSILTLSESSAQLKLAGDTTITLSEDTLIVVLPNEKENVETLKLLFSKGSLRSKNNKNKTNVTIQEWELAAQKGSDLQVRRLSNGHVELELSQGEVTLSNPENKSQETLSTGQLLTLADNQVKERVQLSSQIKFLATQYHRIYAHQFPVSYDLTWKGQAEELTHQNEKRMGTTHRLHGQTLQVRLAPGTHHFRLKGNDGTSVTHQVDVWPAPVIHLYAPLPRHRQKNHADIVFRWEGRASIPNYRWRIVGQTASNGSLEEAVTTDHFTSHQFNSSSLWNWQVFGVDKDGFEIPPLYSYPIHSADQLLDPPILQNPKVRQPAGEKKTKKKKATDSLWQRMRRFFTGILFSTAHAADVPAPSHYEAVFEWSKVSAADHYVVEIDDDPFFRSPIVSQKVSRAQFIWPKATLGIYYWRVAAGSSQQLGSYSAPSKIDLRLSPLEVEKDVAPGVYLKKIVAAPPPTAPPAVKPISPPLPPVSWQFYWAPSYESWQLKTQQGINANFNGLAQGNLGVDLEIPVSQSHSVWWNNNYGQYSWQAKDKGKIPFQQNLQLWLSQHSLLYGDKQSAWLYGFRLQRTPGVLRTDLEQITLPTQWAAGVELLWRDSLGVFSLLSRSYIQVGVYGRYSVPLYSAKGLDFFFRPQLQWLQQSDKNGESLGHRGTLLLPLGFGW